MFYRLRFAKRGTNHITHFQIAISNPPLRCKNLTIKRLFFSSRKNATVYSHVYVSPNEIVLTSFLWLYNLSLCHISYFLLVIKLKTEKRKREQTSCRWVNYSQLSPSFIYYITNFACKVTQKIGHLQRKCPKFCKSITIAA